MTGAEQLLLERGAGTLDHPGGTLFEHVRRVAEILRCWAASDDLQAAGLCHACYGTDGFAPSLLGLDERPRLAEMIGPGAEGIVYRYASCDRSAVYPRLRDTGPLLFTDRFTGLSAEIDDGDADAFVELTAANELDLVRVNPGWASTWAPGFLELLQGARPRVSDVAVGAWTEAMRGSRSTS
jgi:hypothetical protein